MRRKKKVSKKTIIVLLLLALLACYKWLPRHHEIRNVYDEIYWSIMQDGKFDTEASFLGDGMAEYIRYPEWSYVPQDGRDFYVRYYGNEPEVVRIDYLKHRILDILCRDDTSIINTTLYYRAIYDVNEKQLRRLIYVMDDTEATEWECSREKADILLGDHGTTYEKEKDRLMACVDYFIEQWITSNAGKTKFSLDNLGEYTARPVVLGEDIGTGR